MAHILEKLLNDNDCSSLDFLNEFKLWLISDSEENCNEKANFIPYFLNYVKEKCAWLYSKDSKCSESSSKLINENNSPAVINRDISHPIIPTDLKVNFKLAEKDQNCERNENDIGSIYDNKRSKGKDDKVRSSKSISVINNNKAEFFKEETKVVFGEKSFQKSHSFARKSLNFDSQNGNNIKSPNQQNVSRFEENIRSLEAFPPLDAKTNTRSRESKTRRRITPTPVQIINKGSSKFGASKFVSPSEKVSNEVFKKTPYVENNFSNLQSEREMLKIQRNKFSSSNVVSNNFKDLKIDPSSPKKTVNYIIPDPEKVHYKDKLDIFSSVYGTLIDHALVPNVTSEVYFIFELLTSKVSSEENIEQKSNIFCSVHNCTYFGVLVLVKLQNLLDFFDKNTLSSICEIPFLFKFSSQLITFLQNSCKEKEDIVTRLQSLNRVPFLLEEDSRENFIDSHAFTNFRKQRDLFYELLREWQQQSLDCIDAKFQESFTRKAKLLINLGPSNMLQLAKLFQKQMVASCLGLEVNEVYDELLSNIQRNFPDKFEKLHQRFMMPFCVGEPNPPPKFYGAQSFFSELVLAAASPIFNERLKDVFICKIVDLNSTDIFSDELGSLGTVKEKYIFLLHTLRLLGKFLGFLHYLPYRMKESLSANVVNNEINSRKCFVPPLDILKLLKSAVENNRVILTVPWIVEYLSMVDPVTKNFLYIEETLKILAAIYRGNYILSFNSLWFLRLIIGWLFDVLNYPYKYFYLLQPITFEKPVKSEGLDFLAIIDKQLVHSCCPYLIEFKVLIHNFLNGMKNQNKREIRKITPLSTTKTCLSTSPSTQQIEIQLEENFFSLYSESVKKTVEMVSQRVASNVIKRIRLEVTDFKLHSIEYITNHETYKLLSDLGPSNENKLKSFIDSCILELYEKCLAKISNHIYIKCREDINIFMGLLGDDVKPLVMKMCCEISHRYAVDKITDWCDTNLILLDMQGDIKNKLSHLSKRDKEVIVEKDFIISSVIHTLQELTIKMYRSSTDIEFDDLKILSEVPSILKKEMGCSTRKLIFSLTVNLYICLLTYYPEKCNIYCTNFIDIWRLCPKDFDLETYFVGVQNFNILASGQNFELTKQNYIFMLSNLIDKSIFDTEKLKKYVMRLNTFQWKDTKCLEILNCISDILKLTN